MTLLPASQLGLLHQGTTFVTIYQGMSVFRSLRLILTPALQTRHVIDISSKVREKFHLRSRKCEIPKCTRLLLNETIPTGIPITWVRGQLSSSVEPMQKHDILSLGINCGESAQWVIRLELEHLQPPPHC